MLLQIAVLLEHVLEIFFGGVGGWSRNRIGCRFVCVIDDESIFLESLDHVDVGSIVTIDYFVVYYFEVGHVSVYLDLVVGNKDEGITTGCCFEQSSLFCRFRELAHQGNVVLCLRNLIFNAGHELLIRHILVSGGRIDLGNVPLVPGIPDSATYLDQRSRDVHLGMVSKAIADDEGAAIFVVDVLTLETGRCVKVDGLDGIGRGSDSKASRQDVLVTSSRILAVRANNPGIGRRKIGQSDDFGDALHGVQEDVVVGLSSILDPGMTQGSHMIEGFVHFY